MDPKEAENQEKLLHSATRWQHRKKDTTSRLDDCVKNYLRVNKRSLEKNTTVVDAWEEILPAELIRHSRIDGISGGVLQVQVEPGPYMHEMQMLSGELLMLLQDRCPRAGIRKIRLKPRKV